jgi:hypothetical protein
MTNILVKLDKGVQFSLKTIEYVLAGSLAALLCTVPIFGTLLALAIAAELAKRETKYPGFNKLYSGCVFILLISAQFLWIFLVFGRFK